jgi:hypothetical protein
MPIIDITILIVEKRVNRRILSSLLIKTHMKAKSKIRTSTLNKNIATPSVVTPCAKASDGTNKQAHKIIILRQTH